LKFGIAWWLAIDAIVYTNYIGDANTVQFTYMLPAIFATFGLIMYTFVFLFLWEIVDI
jgi:hypothetical protein